MPIGFPPEPRYPLGIDDDYTLFLVYNTSETPITEDNPAWSDEILIKPQDADDPEIWGENGFANLSGELLYYDAVEKNSDDRIFKLKRCARNLGGDPTQFNKKGTIIRGFVVAEHHNQLVDTVCRIEKYINTLNLEEIIDTPDCADDFCPDVTFDFEVENEDNCEGTLISYDIDIVGDFNTFLLDFGDGSSTTSTEDGTHLYAPNTKINPVVRVENSRCTIIQTAVTRNVDDQLEIPTLQEPLTIVIPTIPDIPPLNVGPISVPPADVPLPPVVAPCIDFSPINIPGISIGDIIIPSVITIVPPIPSVISVIPPDLNPISVIPPVISPISVIPPVLTPISVIPPVLTPISIIGTIPSTISIVGDIPSTISIVGDIPSTISIVGDIPSTISIVGDIPSTISLVGGDIPSIVSIVGGDIPSVISVEWGEPPTLSVSIICPSSCGGTTPFMEPLGMFESEDLDMDFDANELGSLEIDYDFAGIPSVISIAPPKFPKIDLNAEGLPSEIKVNTEDFPTEIALTGLDQIPTEIGLVMKDNLEVKLNTDTLPTTIDLNVVNQISEISLVTAPDFPSTILVDASEMPTTLTVTGIPDTIELTYKEEGIQLIMPENPEIEMVYKGAPIDVVLKMDDKLLNEGEGHPCFALVPCNPK